MRVETSTPGQLNHGDYRPEVDGLRAIAVCGVILFHTGLGVASGGYVGVDVFFVISGYLIASIIAREMDEGRFSLSGFYERRIRRIFPALFVVLACTAAAAGFILTPGEFQSFCGSLVATVTFLSNVYFWRTTGYFSGDVEQLPLIQMWSLSVEEQYYLFFPALLLFVAALGRKRFLNPTLSVGFAISLAVCIYYTPDHRVAAFFLTPSRAWELLAGALVAVNQTSWRQRLISRRWAAAGLEMLGAAAIVVPILIYDRTTLFPGVAAIAPVVGTALILLTSSRVSAVGKALASKPLVGIGLISYSAYLWHQPLFALSRAARLTERGAVVYALLIAATFVLSYLTWRFVEKPLRRRERMSRSWVFVGAAVSSAVLIGIGLLGQFTHGLPGRFDRATIALDATRAPSPKRYACHTFGVNYLEPANACRYFGGVAHWAVFGDSHGVEISYALAEQLRPLHQSVLHLTFSSCEPALTFESSTPGCSKWVRQSIAYLESTPNITDVVVVFRHSAYLFGDQTMVYPRQPRAAPTFLSNLPPDRARALYLASFIEVVRRLSAAGKRVYVVEPIPDLPTPVTRYIFTFSRFGMNREPTGVNRQYYRTRNKLILSTMNALRSLPNVTLLDPVPFLCDQRKCASIIGAEAMYFDDNHLSLDGARRFVTAMRASGALPLGVTAGHSRGRWSAETPVTGPEQARRPVGQGEDRQEALPFGPVSRYRAPR